MSHLLKIYCRSVWYTTWRLNGDGRTAITVTFPGERRHLHRILSIRLKASYIQLLGISIQNIKSHWIIQKTLSLGRAINVIHYSQQTSSAHTLEKQGLLQWHVILL